MSNKQRRQQKLRAEKEKAKRAQRKQALAESVPIPDPRVMEKMMWGMFGDMEGPSDTPLHRAQDLVYEGVEQDDPELKVKMAQEALAVCPDCADAYVLLAENANSPKEQLDMYEQGVIAGRRALGPEPFQNDVGHFWGMLETRPYMRARVGLACSLWTLGRRDEAVEHLQDMLRLNPNDNQGIRHILAEYLLNLDRDEELAQLLDRYGEERSAIWTYTRALLAFRREGDTAESRRLLEEAKKANRHVLDYLSGRKLIPGRQPEYYSPGQESEAVVCAGLLLLAWKSTAGALAWAEGKKEGAPQLPAEKTHPKELERALLDMLKALPMRKNVWQADCRPLPMWIKESGQEARPWWIVIGEVEKELVLGQELRPTQPHVKLLWDTLARAMQYPLIGSPHRPEELQVRPGVGWESLQESLQELGIRLVQSDTLDWADSLQEELTEHLNPERESGLLDVPGVTPRQIGSLYESAASYFQRAPWRKIGYEAPIQIECTKFPSKLRYAIVMGKMGQTLGLTLYEDLKLLRRLLTGKLSDEENSRLTVAATVIYGKASEIPVADLEAAERHGWKVAGPEAYPWFFHKDRGQSPRSLLYWETELMEACLRAVPDFVNRHRQDDPAKEEMIVTVASGDMPMTLSWVVD
jgi:tetratricopeptide (TPR) repeat protein